MSSITQDKLIEEVEQLRMELEMNNNFYKKHLKYCRKIEIKLSLKEYEQKKLIKLKYEIVKLKHKIKGYEDDRTARAITFSSGAILIYGMVSLIYKTMIQFNTSSGWAGYFTNNMFNLVVFTSMGILGALARFFSKLLEKNDDARFIIAILFPTIFVSLFSYNGNEVIGVSKINVLMFAGGYSAEFILAFLNKIMDIAKKVTNLDDSSNKEQEKLIKNSETTTVQLHEKGNEISNNHYNENAKDKDIPA